MRSGRTHSRASARAAPGVAGAEGEVADDTPTAVIGGRAVRSPHDPHGRLGGGEGGLESGRGEGRDGGRGGGLGGKRDETEEREWAQPKSGDGGGGGGTCSTSPTAGTAGATVAGWNGDQYALNS